MGGFKVAKPVEFLPWPGMIVGELPGRSTVVFDCPGCSKVLTYPRRRLVAWAGPGRRIDTLWADYGCQLCDPVAQVVTVLRLPPHRPTGEAEAQGDGPRWMASFARGRDKGEEG